MGIVDIVEEDLAALSSAFPEKTRSPSVRSSGKALEERLRGVRYESGYSIPKAHIDKLASLLGKDQDTISKKDVVELFLTQHGVSLSTIENESSAFSRAESFRSLLEQRKYTIEETDNVENLDSVQGTKRSDDWAIVFYYLKKRLFRGETKEVVSFEIYNRRKANDTGILLQSKAMKELLGRGLELKLGLSLFGHINTWQYERIRRGPTAQIYEDVKSLFETDKDLKKLNSTEVLREISLMISSSSQPTDIYFAEYSVKRFFPYLLVVGEPDVLGEPVKRVDVHPRRELERLGLAVKPGIWFNISTDKMDVGTWKSLQELTLTTLSIFEES